MTDDARPVSLGPTRATTSPLSRTQQLVWASQRLHPEVPLANMADALRIRGDLDADRLVRAFDEVVQASPGLRTVIVDHGRGATAQVLRRPPATTEVLDLPAADLDDWLAARVSTPIDATSCVYDSVLLRHGADDWTWFLDIHHVAIDAWSASLVVAATSRVYGGEPAGVDGEPLGGFAGWVERTVHAPDAASPTASSAEPWAPYGRRGQRTTAVERVPLGVSPDALDAGLAGSYRSISRELSLLALATTVTAVFAHRADGRTAFTVGVPIHHRRDAASREVVGPLMELFALDVTIDPEATWRTQFTSVLREIMALLRRAEPGSSGDERFEVVVNVITATWPDVADLPTERRWIRAGHVDPNHVIRHQLHDRGGSGREGASALEWELDVNTSLSADGSHRQFPDHLRALLTAALADPESAHRDAIVASAADLSGATAVGVDDDGAAVPAPLRRVEQVVAERLRADPDRVVVRHGEQAVTAGAFEQRVARAAATLRRRGARQGSAIGVRLPRSVDLLVAIQGVLRTGGHLILLDPRDPTARHDHVMSSAGIEFLIDDGDALDDGIEDDEAAPIHESLDDLAYVLFTSGSTGLPKGVPISHRGLASYLAFAAEAYTDHEPPTVALHSSVAFDLTITSLFLSFLTGGEVVVFDEEPVEAMRAIVAHGGITWMKATPSHLELLQRIADDARLPLRHLVVGGEAFRRPLAERIVEVAPDVRIFNEYGPTEAVVGCMIHEWDPEVDAGPDVPIGRTAPDARLVVLDAVGRVAPEGVWGELHVWRDGMADGYLDRPDETAARFVRLAGADIAEATGFDDSTLAHTNWYRTGDRVRVQRPGVLVFGGRADDQLSVGGVRLEPAEVEAALVEHPAIESAFVRTWTLREPDPVLIERCVRCGLGDDVPGITIDGEQVCSTCRAFERVEPQTRQWFRTDEDLAAELADARRRRTGEHDALHLLSGGKDSTYALYQLVDRGWKVHALTLDNGFISEGAKENIRRSVADLGITHEFATTDAMAEIFRDSLARHSNVCQGCYKTIYTLAVARARELGAPAIVTGLSRGQFFETRLLPHQFEAGRFDAAAIDATVAEARRVYHSTPDAVTRLLPEQRVFDDPSVLDELRFVDFYRYVDVELVALYQYLDERAPWVRPDDTGRSTNCLINVAGIATHRREQGYHSYAEPYAWDVRLGHKTRDEALEELDDEIDADEVDELLAAVGYEPSDTEVLTAWYTSAGDAPVDASELRRFLRDRLPSHAVPTAFVRIEELPTAASGKVDAAALPAPGRVDRHDGELVRPATATEATVAAIWAEVLQLDVVGVTDDFFDLGGSSLPALEVVAALDDEFGTDLPDAAVFRARTVRELAALVDAATGDDGDDGGRRVSADDIPVLGSPVPLSAAQEAMLLDVRTSGDPTRYLVNRVYRMRLDPDRSGAADLDGLADAVRDIVEAHDVLRTCFDPARTVLDRDESVAWTDLGECEPEVFDSVVAAERAIPIDLVDGPLIHGFAARTGDGEVSLLLRLHHLTTDAASCDLLLDQILRRWFGGELPTLPVSYASYTAWCRSRADDVSIAYWVEQAPDHVEPHGLVGTPGETDGYVERPLGPTTSRLRAASTTTFAAALAAAGVTYATFRGTDDAEFGVTVSTRMDAIAGDLIGYFVNPLPVTISTSSTTRVDDLVARSIGTIADVVAHRTVPFADVVSARRDAGKPAPDISLMLAHESGAALDVDGVRVEDEIISSGTAITDATLFLKERGERLTAAIEYRGETIGADRAERLLDLFVSAIDAVVSAPTTTVGALRSVAAGADLIGADRGSHAATVPAGVIARIDRDPSSPAILTADGGVIEAGAVGAFAARLLSDLDDLPPGGAVGVATGRRPELIVAMLATWASGRVYVPLDVTLPAERLAGMVDAAGVTAVVVAEGERPSFLARTEVDVPVLTASVDHQFRAASDLDVLRVRIADLDPESPAYIVFTSGSTGTPRGVVVSHRAIAASTSARDVWYPEAPSRFVVSSSPGFDSSLVGLLWPLVSGGAVVLPDDADIGDVDRLAALVERTSASHVLMVPSLYGALLRRAPERLRGLHTAIVAGEACPAELVRRHHEQLPGVALVNEYGPTEAAVWSTAAVLDPGVDELVPIGGPTAGVRLRVVGRGGAPVPVGSVGELLVGGDQLAAGYLDDPVSTETSFVELDGRRWYCTGDLVRVDGGELRFLGRVDDQLSVGGLRVEPEEIERVLRRVPAIADAAVVASDAATLVAHVVMVAGASVDVAAVRRELAASLPAGVIPGRIVQQSALPHTSNGKLDRRAVAELPVAAERAAELPARIDRSTGGGLDELVLGAWRSVFEVDVDAGSDFFELGGDSLRAVTLVTELGDAIGRRVPIATLLTGRTPSGMVEILSASGDLEPTDARRAARADVDTFDQVTVVPMRAGSVDGPFVLMVASWDEVFGYQDLADALPADADVVALGHDPDAASADDRPLERVDDYVDDALRRLDGVIPVSGAERSVIVVGWSIGGVVAMELAARLREIGVVVTAVGLVDTLFPGEEQHLWNNRWWKYRSLLTPRGVGEIGREAGVSIRRLIRRIARSLGGRLIRFGGGAVQADEPIRRLGQFPAAAFEHEPSRVDVPVVFFAATGSNPKRTHRRWIEVADDLRVVSVQGRHRGFESVMGAERVPHLVDGLSEFLRR